MNVIQPQRSISPGDPVKTQNSVPNKKFLEIKRTENVLSFVEKVCIDGQLFAEPTPADCY